MWPLFTTWSGGEIRISADQTGGRFPPSARRFFSGGRPVDFAPVVGHVIQIAVGVWHLHVDGGRDHAVAHGEQAGGNVGGVRLVHVDGGRKHAVAHGQQGAGGGGRAASRRPPVVQTQQPCYNYF